jgi:hypothetical protein
MKLLSTRCRTGMTTTSAASLCRSPQHFAIFVCFSATRSTMLQQQQRTTSGGSICFVLVLVLVVVLVLVLVLVMASHCCRCHHSSHAQCSWGEHMTWFVVSSDSTMDHRPRTPYPACVCPNDKQQNPHDVISCNANSNTTVLLSGPI